MTIDLKKKIYVIEDEEDISELLHFNLTAVGFDVKCFDSGEKGLKAVETDLPDLVLLDLMLPGVDGLTICKLIRAGEKTRDVPIIMITAKGEEEDIVKGLELGADDYLPKPFSTKVLTARVNAVMRRKSQRRPGPSDTLEIAGIRIHPGRHEVYTGEARVDLTSTEFKLLHLLAQRPGWVFTRSQIVDAIRGENHAVTDRSVDVQVVGLRRKLSSYGEMIETVRGVGYRFKEA